MKGYLRIAITWLIRLGLPQQARRAKKRSCGGCTACCTIRGVLAFEKPPGVACQHQVARGCAIYAARPDECRDYLCAWRLGFLGPGERPDKVDIVADFQTHGLDAPDGGWSWTIRPGPNADPEQVAWIAERINSEYPRHTAVVPFGLPGAAEIAAAAPGTEHFRALLRDVRSGRLALVATSDDGKGTWWREKSSATTPSAGTRSGSTTT